MRRPTILVTGAAGQVGFELVRLLAPHGDVIAADRARLDLADPDAVVAAGYSAGAVNALNAIFMPGTRGPVTSPAAGAAKPRP